MKEIVKSSSWLISNVQNRDKCQERRACESIEIQKGQQGGIIKYITLMNVVTVMKWTKSLEDRSYYYFLPHANNNKNPLKSTIFTRQVYQIVIRNLSFYKILLPENWKSWQIFFTLWKGQYYSDLEFRQTKHYRRGGKPYRLNIPLEHPNKD